MQNLTTNSFDNITRIEYQGQLVLTTAQLAEVLSSKGDRLVTANALQVNFKNNRDRFIEGKHYFKLEGDELAIFKNEVKNFQVVTPRVNVLYLWTKRGVARHCKSVNSEVAWDVYEALEDAYFNPTVDYNDTTPGADFWWEVEKPKRKSQRARALELQCVRELRRHAELADAPELKRRLLAKAASLLLGEENTSEPLAQLTLFR